MKGELLIHNHKRQINSKAEKQGWRLENTWKEQINGSGATYEKAEQGSK